MTGFTPSATQAAAIREIKEWFETRTAASQIFRLFGYAGSGKSTVLKFALDELGLSPHRSTKDGHCVPGVVTATFTGKAALVLTRKGTPARTIHSLIYSVIEATEEEIAEAATRMSAPNSTAFPRSEQVLDDTCSWDVSSSKPPASPCACADRPPRAPAPRHQECRVSTEQGAE